MHFVKKVPTSEEEQKAKEAEQKKRVVKYQAARDRIFEKRKNGGVLFFKVPSKWKEVVRWRL